MDAKNALEAVEAIRDAVSIEELAAFDTELANRMQLVGEATGVVTLAEAVEKPETGFEIAIGNFLDASAEATIIEQMAVMTEFWSKLGYILPPLSNSQYSKLTRVIEAHPDCRVIPTPLLDIAGRREVAEKAKAVFAKNILAKEEKPFCVINDDGVYDELLANPEETVEDKGRIYGLRYKDYDFTKNLTRREYIDALMQEGHAMLSPDGIPWTFPVVGIQHSASQHLGEVHIMHGSIMPNLSPESMLTVQLLHQANGTPRDDWYADVTNEAIYEIDPQGGADRLVGVASVNFSPNYRQIFLSIADRDRTYPNLGMRLADNGI